MLYARTRMAAVDIKGLSC